MKIVEDHVLEVGSRQYKKPVIFGLLDDGRYIVRRLQGAPEIISAEKFKNIEETGIMNRSSMT